MLIPAIPSDLAQFVSEQVGSGKYSSEAEVVCDGLRLLQSRERRLAELREEIAPALERLMRGEGRELDVEDVVGRAMARRQQPESPT